MMEIRTVTTLRQFVDNVVHQVKKRTTARWLEHQEAARAHRCQIASNQALRDLEDLKSGVRSESYRTSFYR